MLGAIRPDEVNFPLFLHVFGAMLLVGTLFAVALATTLAWRRPEDASGLTRFALRTLLLGVLPAYILMRVGAQWTASKENIPDDSDPAWLGLSATSRPTPAPCWSSSRSFSRRSVCGSCGAGPASASGERSV